MNWLQGERRARAQTALIAVGIALGIGFVMQEGRVFGHAPALPYNALSLSAIATAQNGASYSSARTTTLPAQRERVRQP